MGGQSVVGPLSRGYGIYTCKLIYINLAACTLLGHVQTEVHFNILG